MQQNNGPAQACPPLIRSALAEKGCGGDELGAEAPLACEVLAALRFAAWPEPPAVRDRRPAPASTASNSHASGCDATDSDGDCEQCRPRKVRVLPSAAGGAAAVLARRTYTWRGISSRRAQKQQRQLEALQQQQQKQVQAAASPAHSSGSADTAACATPGAASVTLPTSGGGSSSSSSKEGDRDWAALTTWLRMNIHNPRTAKKLVLFVGQHGAAPGRWTFGLNPSLSWADVSPDTRHRLRHLPAEAEQAFRRKYPNRPPGDWRIKSQKYEPPASTQMHLVLLEDLVLALHAVWQQHEGGATPGASRAAAAASHTAASTAAAADGCCPELEHAAASTARSQPPINQTLAGV